MNKWDKKEIYIPNIKAYCAMITKPISIFILCLYALSTPAYSEATTRFADMARKAQTFLDSLPAKLRESAEIRFDSNERFNWAYIPTSREGLSLKNLDRKQRNAAMALLKSGLSISGYQKATDVMALESVLRELEGSSYRDAELYYLSIFGAPSLAGTWGWRFEGHHLSLNYTIVDGNTIAVTPNFWGANPANVKSGKRKGLRVLAKEEDLAHQLVHSMSKEQLKSAIVNKSAYREIRTRTKETVTPLQPSGIFHANLNDDQRSLLYKLIETYIENMSSEIANERLASFRKMNKRSLSFAWAGDTNPEERHYYRIQSNTFLIEYDNYQNSGNHIHAVWRNFKGDFGRDLLKEHYQKHNHAQTPE